MARNLTLDAIQTVLTQYAGRYSCLHVLACQVDDLLATAHPRVDVTVWSMSGVVRCRIAPHRAISIAAPAPGASGVLRETVSASARVARPDGLTLAVLRRDEGPRHMVVAFEDDGWRPYHGRYHQWAAVALN